ncbi:MAG: peroxidase [Candidatus Melainabacteria bacterium]|nr:MAG: peroxidase [Candidatus Melainabacteria bacterium]
MPYAAYVLVRFNATKSAKEWLSEVAKRCTPADVDSDVEALNIALTYSGLLALELDQSIADSFSHPFIEGMITERRSRILGDTYENNPKFWTWGTAQNPVHALIMQFANTQSLLQEKLEEGNRLSKKYEISNAATIIATKTESDYRKEHFGFVDGIGQPVIKGSDLRTNQLKRTGHATEIETGDFILGYDDQYGSYAHGPIVPKEHDPRVVLPKLSLKAATIVDNTKFHDLGRNGSYLVFRQLAQDVAKFWQYMDDAQKLSPNRIPSPEWLASRFVGRCPNGQSLMLNDMTNAKEETDTRNDFGYRQDERGTKCPFGAHVRRANPRDSLGPNAEQSLLSANRHRILRRGRSYGEPIANNRVDDKKPRGLNFICINADIERQFEFVQQTWIGNPVLNGLFDEVDPLTGSQNAEGGTFSIPTEDVRIRVKGIPQFVTVKGGAYFFLPGIRALKFLAGM